MSDQVKITGFATAQWNARTLGDLRKVVAWCDEHRIPDTADLDWGYGTLYVELVGGTAVEGDMIECGDHIPPDRGYDILLPTHPHTDEKTPAKFDWPSKDRLKEADERLRRLYKQSPDTWEEALEQSYDRYSDDRMPG